MMEKFTVNGFTTDELLSGRLWKDNMICICLFFAVVFLFLQFLCFLLLSNMTRKDIEMQVNHLEKVVRNLDEMKDNKKEEKTGRYLRELGDKIFFEAIEKGEVNPELSWIVLEMMKKRDELITEK